MMNTDKNELYKITAILLEPDDHYPELLNAVNDYYHLLLSAVGLKQDTSVEAADAQPQNPLFAPYFSMRIKDILRTKRFTAGIFKAVREAQNRFSGTKLHILYVGGDPFASLALPLTTAFASSDISFTFLADRPYAVECLKKVIESFGIQDYVTDIKYCDPATYKTDSSSPVHMVINEMLRCALDNEAQVGITLNLVPQMVDGGILVPESISVEAGLLNPRRHNERMMGINLSEQNHILMLKKIFELDQNIHTLHPDYDPQNKVYTFPQLEVTIPQDISEEYTHLCLFTTLHIFDGECLTHWQSGLSMPKTILELNRKNPSVEKVSFRYIVGSNSYFEYTIG